MQRRIQIETEEKSRKKRNEKEEEISNGKKLKTDENSTSVSFKQICDIYHSINAMKNMICPRWIKRTNH